MKQLKKIWGKVSRGAKLILVLGVSTILLGSWAMVASEPAPIRGGNAPTITPEPTVQDNSSAAYTMAKRAVEARLKAPATADFPWLNYTVNQLSDGTYVVTSYVDAENSFGAKIRSNWTVQLKHLGGDRLDVANWDISVLEIDGESYL